MTTAQNQSLVVVESYGKKNLFLFSVKIKYTTTTHYNQTQCFLKEVI